MSTRRTSHAGRAGDLSPQELRQFWREQLECWVNAYVDQPDLMPAGWDEAEWTHRCPNDTIEAAADAIVRVRLASARSDDDYAAIRRELEPLLARGLLRRFGRFVLPTIGGVEMQLDEEATSHHLQVLGRDRLAWTVLAWIYDGVGGDSGSIPSDWGGVLKVCSACTLVFRPRRKVFRAHGKAYCPLCTKRPAKPALEDLKTADLLRRGKPATIRVLHSEPRSLLPAWRTVTVARCDCGIVYYKKKGAMTCGSSGCETRARRAAA